LILEEVIKMLAKRIIPCLDVRNGKVVKGVNFEGVKDVGDPVAYAEEYNRQGADELVFYDITASYEGRGVFLDVVRETAKKVFVPLTVGGGISTVGDFRETLRAGADKVSINSSAVKNPKLIKEAADIFGSQCVVVGIDAKRDGKGGYTVYINGGRVDMKLDLIEWVRKIENFGAGEICLNSIDTDGTKAGFDIEMLNAVCNEVNIPVIASGGCGKIDDFAEVFEKTNASAGLAASLFHFKELTVGEVKKYLKERNFPVR
jgi:cyclase